MARPLMSSVAESPVASPAPSTPPSWQRGSRGALVIIATLAVVTALSIGRVLFVPIALALVFATVLRPVVRWLERLRIPASAAAAIVVLVTIALATGIGMAASRPVEGIAAQVPRSVRVARAKLDAITARVRALGGLESPASGGASINPSGPAVPSAGGAQPAPGPGSSGSAGGPFSLTTSLLGQIVEEVLLVYFLLAAGDSWIGKMKAMARSPRGERLWPSIAGEVHDVVARYLLVTVIINICQSVIIGLALWAVGFPTPALWAALTFVAELVPYLGGAVMIGLLLAAGFGINMSLAQALIAPGIYLAVTSLQNNLVSPIAYGRGLRLNPTMILISVMFWWLIWGVAGAFLAVPILASLRVVAARLPALEPLAVLLEE